MAIHKSKKNIRFEVHLSVRIEDGTNFSSIAARKERSEERRVGKECGSTCR